MLIDKLIGAIAAKRNPTVVGLDPQMDFIPEKMLKDNIERHGETPEAAANAFYEFNVSIIDCVYEDVPAVKLQIAMYEQFGAAGIKCYRDTLEYAKSRGLIVIGDIKRNDIASSASCYSTAHLGETRIGNSAYRAFPSDFITVNPYLGEDSLNPFFDDCKKYDRGAFVLVKTSNPGGGLFQDVVSEGVPLYERVGGFVESVSAGLTGERGYSNIGAVVGATYPEQLKALRRLMPHVFFLIPGYGAQGADADSIAHAFDKNGTGAIINSSRGIIAAHTRSAAGFEDSVKEAVYKMKKDLLRVLKF